MHKIFEINGMNCNHCKEMVEKTLVKISGIYTADVNLSERSVSVDCDNNIDFNLLQPIIDDIGYELVCERN